MTAIAISQSMLFPWVGMLEQVMLSDIFVHYDDVQFSKGSFVNRVQIKAAHGIQWMTVPVRGLHLGQKIDEVKMAPMSEWRDHHIAVLEQSFDGAPYAHDALKLVRDVYSVEYPNIGAIARASLLSLVDYFDIGRTTRFIDVKPLGLDGRSYERVLSVIKHFDADTYITGHGASRYLDHNVFESAGVNILYMKYLCRTYPQLHGDFTPYVSGLDLVANCGKDGVRYICPNTVDWKEFINEQT